ncbi:hypothetical protein QTO34_014353 [Cnephaeus nilssonii]|uniref:Uncharacterized protein n=1 Tax=Cnephaeus nilssonii TaxID=3371016 RepID=A0AA40LS79_CNENI|nr:hypothetical protein QTO34_014353 [Eptesicus nilssonii]
MEKFSGLDKRSNQLPHSLKPREVRKLQKKSLKLVEKCAKRQAARKEPEPQPGAALLPLTLAPLCLPPPLGSAAAKEGEACAAAAALASQIATVTPTFSNHHLISQQPSTSRQDPPPALELPLAPAVHARCRSRLLSAVSGCEWQLPAPIGSHPLTVRWPGSHLLLAPTPIAPCHQQRPRESPALHERTGSCKRAGPWLLSQSCHGRGLRTGRPSTAAPSAEAAGEGASQSQFQCCPFRRGSHRGTARAGPSATPPQRLDRVRPAVPQPPTALPPADLAPDRPPPTSGRGGRASAKKQGVKASSGSSSGNLGCTAGPRVESPPTCVCLEIARDPDMAGPNPIKPRRVGGAASGPLVRHRAGGAASGPPSSPAGWGVRPQVPRPSLKSPSPYARSDSCQCDRPPREELRSGGAPIGGWPEENWCWRKTGAGSHAIGHPEFRHQRLPLAPWVLPQHRPFRPAGGAGMGTCESPPPAPTASQSTTLSHAPCASRCPIIKVNGAHTHLKWRAASSRNLSAPPPRLGLDIALDPAATPAKILLPHPQTCGP